MKKGDWVLFYKSGEFVYAGKLYYKQRSRDLGLSLWPPKPNEKPWTCIFFLKDLQAIKTPLNEIREAAGYSQGFIVQGFMPLNKKGVKSILGKFGTVDNFINKYSVEVSAVHQRDKSEKVVSKEIESDLSHTEAEMLLLKIGKLLGYDTYSPNKNISAYNEPLSNYITVNEIPKRFLGDMLNIVSQIDVIWFKDDVPTFAFEVEYTTGVATGVQRLYQLVPLKTELFVIAKEETRRLFEKFVDSNPYYTKREQFHFKTYDQLEDYFNYSSEFQAMNKAFLGKEAII